MSQTQPQRQSLRDSYNIPNTRNLYLIIIERPYLCDDLDDDTKSTMMSLETNIHPWSQSIIELDPNAEVRMLFQDNREYQRETPITLMYEGDADICQNTIRKLTT